MNRLQHLAAWLAAFAAVAALMAYGAWSDQRMEEGDIRHSRDWAARQVCGSEAAWKWLDNQTLQCYTHKATKTGGNVIVAGTAK